MLGWLKEMPTLGGGYAWPWQRAVPGRGSPALGVPAALDSVTSYRKAWTAVGAGVAHSAAKGG